MKNHGRLILNKHLSSAQGLAIDESLCSFVAEKKVPPTLHLYDYVPSVIVGRYQNVAASLRLDKCEKNSIEVNRRISGGGTVFMTPDQVALALVLPKNFPGLPPTIQGSFEFLASVFSTALKEFGLSAEFMGKNDLTVGGKKIAGLAISQDQDGVTFFHTSLLLDFDLETMLEILNLPTERLLDRGISCFGKRMTTINKETGKKNNLKEVQDAIHRATEKCLGLEFPIQEILPEEVKNVNELKKLRYENDEWIYGIRTPKRRMSSVERKTAGGLLQLHLCLSGSAIESVIITGDYFSRTRDIAKLESLLKWTSFKREAIESKLKSSKATEFIHRVDLPLILDLIEEAVAKKEESPL
jgi:lipoate---protein ligase